MSDGWHMADVGLAQSGAQRSNAVAANVVSSGKNRHANHIGIVRGGAVDHPCVALGLHHRSDVGSSLIDELLHVRSEIMEPGPRRDAGGTGRSLALVGANGAVASTR